MQMFCKRNAKALQTSCKHEKEYKNNGRNDLAHLIRLVIEFAPHTMENVLNCWINIAPQAPK